MPAADFAPPRWLRNPHLQSLLASARARRALIDDRELRAASEPVLLDCGDGVRLLALHARRPDAGPDTPVAVLVHGWEGSAESTYLVGAGAALYRRGVEVVRLNLRDHGDTHHLNAELFHSCLIDEAVGALAAIARRVGDRPLYLAGWSLGGNFAVRMTQRAPAAGVALAHTLAVSPVVDPANSYNAMRDGVFFYRRYFVRKWQRSLRRKQSAFPDRYDFAPVLRMDDLHAMTAYLLDQYGLFASVEDYFRGYALDREMLEGAVTPLTVITAADDPVIPGDDFAPFRSGGNFTLRVLPNGGHCGFMERIGAHSWVDGILCHMITENRRVGTS